MGLGNTKQVQEVVVHGEWVAVLGHDVLQREPQLGDLLLEAADKLHEGFGDEGGQD